MASTWTDSDFELQGAGENLNTWGVPKLNNNLSRINYLINGYISIAITGDYALTTQRPTVSMTPANFTARIAMLKFTGSLSANATITVPSVPARFMVYNATNKSLVFTTGAGSTVTVESGDRIPVDCDGSNCLTLSYGTYSLKDYITAQTASAGAVPGTTGHLGKFLKVTVDGSAPTWQALAIADISDLTPANIGAATAAAPTITGGMTLSGGMTFTGTTKQNVQALAALAIDWSVAEGNTKSISTNSTFTFTGFTGSKMQIVILELTISSAAVPTWPASVKWSGGNNPSGALGNGRHVLAFLTMDGGTTVTGFVGAVAAA